MVDHTPAEEGEKEETEGREGTSGKAGGMGGVGGVGGAGGSVGAGEASEELIRAREMVRHLQEERTRLLGLVSDLQVGQAALEGETLRLHEERERRDRDREASGGERDGKEAAALLALQHSLQVSEATSLFAPYFIYCH